MLAAIPVSGNRAPFCALGGLIQALLQSMLKKISFYFYVFYCFEVGIFLMTAPWFLPNVWENNYFFFVYPNLKAIFLNAYFRGAVSGVGFLNVSLAVSEVIQRERAKHMLQSGAGK